MVKGPLIKVKPWCPFCGLDVDKPQEPVQRKMDEFTTGTCQCGAVYTCDPTGFNVGAAMVECLVHACNDNWDLAWELIPDEDYISGRLDKYDEETHQVIDTGNYDGRKIRGVLYFIRLSKDYAELSQKLDTDKKAKESKSVPVSNSNIPEMEPARDPKRKKKRANKKQVADLASAEDIDALVDLAFDDNKTLRFLQRLLYSPDDELRWKYAHIIGQVCRRLSTRKPGTVSDMLHRMYEACSDSAASHWGLLETVGSVIAARPDIYGGFTRHLLMFRGADTSRVIVLWAMGSIAETRPDLVRSTPFYSLFEFIEHPDPSTRGHAARLFGRVFAQETRSGLEKLLDDGSVITIFEHGKPEKHTVSNLAKEAMEKIDSQTQ